MNKHYRKGVDLEYEVQNFFRYMGFNSQRSYASKGVCDLILFPPKESTEPRGLGIQVKNTKKEDYIGPGERLQLKQFSEKYRCIVIEAFKKKSTCMVKMTPWELSGEILKLEDFLERYYGLDADSWKTMQNNWRHNIRRKTKSEKIEKYT